MPRRPADDRSPSRRSDLLARVVLLAAPALALPGLVVALRYGVPLRALHPRGWPLLVAALAASAVLGVLAPVSWAVARRRGPAPRGTTLLRLLAYVLAAALVVQLVAFQPPHRIGTLCLFGLAGGAFAALVVLGPRLARRLPRRLTTALDASLAALAVITITVELGLRVTSAVSPSPIFAGTSESASRRLSRLRLPPGAVHQGLPLNSRGDNDREPDGIAPTDRLVVCIGDSFSLGVVPHPYHFTTLAEALLPDTEVYNMGTLGIGPDEYLLLLLDEALPLEPDLVVVDLFLGNDVTDVRVPDAERGAWSARDGWLTWLVAERLLAVSAEEPAAIAPPTPVAADGEQLSRLLPWLQDAALERPTYTESGYRDSVARRAVAVCGPPEGVYEPLFAALDRIVRACGDVPLAVMLIPDEFQVEDRWWDAVVAAHPDVTLDRDQPQRLIGAWLAERGIPHLDLTPVLRAVPPQQDGDRHLYHRRDVHFNAAGNRVTAQALATFLDELRGPR